MAGESECNSLAYSAGEVDTLGCLETTLERELELCARAEKPGITAALAIVSKRREMAWKKRHRLQDNEAKSQQKGVVG